MAYTYTSSTSYALREKNNEDKLCLFVLARGAFFFISFHPFHSFNRNTKNGKSYNVIRICN